MSEEVKKFQIIGTSKPDWNQNDENKPDYIKNKPDEVTPDMIMELLDEVGVIKPIADVDGSVITTNDNEILIL